MQVNETTNNTLLDCDSKEMNKIEEKFLTLIVGAYLVTYRR